MGFTCSGFVGSCVTESQLDIRSTGTEYATANSTAVNIALAAGKDVQLAIPGRYYFNNIVLYANSGFSTSPGVEIIQTSGITNTRFISNNALVNGISVTVTSLTADANNLCTCVCSAAHGLIAGDYANVSWANEKGYNGNQRVITVSTTSVANDTFTYMAYEKPSASTATVFNQVLTGTITAITKANPCVVTINTVSTTNPFSALQYVKFSGISGMTELNGTNQGIRVIGGASGAWTITLGNLETGVGLNSTAYGTWTSGGTVTLRTRPLANIGPRIYSNDVETIMVRQCDVNVRLKLLGTVNQNNNMSYGDNYSSCALLAFVQSGEATVSQAKNTKGWPLYLSGVGDFDVYDVGMTGSTQPIGGFQNVGWCKDLRVHRVKLDDVVDNVCTFSNYDGSQYVWQNGITCGECDYVVDLAVSDSKTAVFNAVNQPIVPFLIFGVANFPITAKYGKLRSTSSQIITSGFAVQPDVIDAAGPWIRSLIAQDTHFVGAGIVTNTVLQGKIDNLQFGAHLEGANLNFAVATGVGAVIDNFEYRVLSLDGATFSGNAAYGMVNLAAGSVRSFNLTGACRLTTAIGNFLIKNIAKLGIVNLTNVDAENFTYIYTETTAATNFTSPYSHGLLINCNQSFVGGLVDINNGSTRSINFGSNTIFPSNYLIKHRGGGTLFVNSAGNDWTNMAVGQLIDPTSNGLAVQVNGADLFCNPALLTTAGSPSGAGVLLVPNNFAGQCCNSGNAGANMAGFSTCAGGHWFAVATGAAGVNTQITGT